MKKKYGAKAIGVYTHSQQAAKALAVVMGCSGYPEVHAPGMYGHYNDPNHTLHIWFGGQLNYF